MKRKNGVISFWCLNHDLEDHELKWQLNELKDKGFCGVFIHPRDGLLTPYLSEHWFEKVEVIIDKCRELDLDVWLYDEDPFPSGTASGRVIADYPEYRARALHNDSFEVNGGKVCIDFPMGRLLRAVAIPVQPADSVSQVDITKYVGTIRKEWKPARISHHNYYPPYHAAGNPHWRTDATGTSFRLECTLPEGSWKICAFIERVIDAQPWDGYTDVLNPEAVGYFMKLTHESYFSRFGSYFGREIKGIFTDEAKVFGSVSWTREFPNHFQQSFGYDIEEHLPHLWYTLGRETAQIRHDYRYALGDLFKKSYITPIFNWCEEKGIISTGHISPEEDPIGQTIYSPYLLSVLKQFHLPGTDLIAGQIGSAEYPLLHMGPKLASSAAHHMGKNEAIVEAFGANSWELGFKEMKKMADWLMVMGVTDITIHGQFYSVDGPRKKEAPPSLFYQSSHWPFFSSFISYISEISELVKQGTHKCHVLLYYPQASFSAYYPDRVLEMNQLRTRLGDLMHQLLSHQWDFDLVDEESLLHMKTSDGKIRGIQETYDVLLLPWCEYLEDGVSHWCRELVADGGQVWLLGSEPQLIRSCHVGKERLQEVQGKQGDQEDQEIDLAEFWNRHVTLESLPGDLSKTVKREIELLQIRDDGTKNHDVKGIYMQLREIGEVKRVFLVNALDCEFRGEIINQQNRKASIYIPPYGSIIMDVEPEALHHQKLSGIAARQEIEAARGGQEQIVDLASDWKVAPEADNVLVLTQWHFWEKNLGPEADWVTTVPPIDIYEQPGLLFSGDGWGFARFFVKGEPQTTKLVFEKSAWEGECEILVNGHSIPAPVQVRRFDVCNYEADITAFILGGEALQLNLVELRFKHGRLMEPLRIYGDFHLSMPYSGFSIGHINYEGNPAALFCLTSWEELGYPHYSGTVSYEKCMDLPEKWGNEESQCIYFSAEDICDVATLFVNGIEAGTRMCKPFVWEVTSLVNSGSNQYVLKVANSPLSLFQGAYVKSGIFGAVKLIREESESR
ncbi:glycosyl hydrolase [Paenibacillus eucommiae]|uniref:Uncharacterized protein n=1 Tax=Paenibacillus eucommiae TaxID=1355755 RepID=A0ABS4J5K0_9BACL|nr:glycosyl hydrolase [Paenibacillus eucommiae]MBP1995102.1 hypothetical protein [Paenibacillus eucommiae]